MYAPHNGWPDATARLTGKQQPHLFSNKGEGVAPKLHTCTQGWRACSSHACRVFDLFGERERERVAPRFAYSCYVPYRYRTGNAHGADRGKSPGGRWHGQLHDQDQSLCTSA